jgi:hypothetical protein
LAPPVNVEQRKVSYDTAQTALDPARSTLLIKQANFERQNDLVQNGITSESSLNQPCHATGAESRCNGRATRRQCRRSVWRQRRFATDDPPAVQAALQFELACRIRARPKAWPPPTVISKIGSLNVGQFVATGITIASLIETEGIGISLVSAVLSNMMHVNYAERAERLTPSSQAVQTQMPGLLTGNPQIFAVIIGLVQQQSAILSYLDDFWLMMLLIMGAIPLILLLRGPKKSKDAAPKTKQELAIERAHAMAE